MSAPAVTAPTSLLAVRREAVATLLANWRGSSTVPTAGLYPHQWSWDSAFVALGLAEVSPRRAWAELTSLLGGQWQDGRVPHIVFHRAVPEDAYFPGPPFWRPLPGPAAGGPARGVTTSGLVQPPVHAVAALAIARRSPGAAARAALARAYPRLAAWHDYLFVRRAVAGGLVAIVHPWESGLDNSPAWDEALAAVPTRPAAAAGVAQARRDLDHAGRSHRPTHEDYARYVAIATAYRDRGYADDDLTALPFCVVDPLFVAVLAWAELALAEIAVLVGLPRDRRDHHEERARALSAAAQERLFDRDLGAHVALDARTGRPRRVRTVGGLASLLLPGLAAEQERALVATLTGPAFRLGDPAVHGVPSYDLTAPDLDPHRYWRGPSWISTGWLVWRGLLAAGEPALARVLEDELVGLVAGAGFREYFDPWTGDGLGARDFSWSAALVLDLLASSPARAPV